MSWRTTNWRSLKQRVLALDCTDNHRLRASFRILLALALLATIACSEQDLNRMLLPGGAAQPSVVASHPVPGSVGQGPFTDAWVLFSEPMDRDKTQTALRLSGAGRNLSGSFRWEGTKLFYDLAEPAGGGDEHLLLVGRSAESAHGVNLPEDFVVRFFPGNDAGGPELLSSDPADGSTLLPTQSITLVFSEPVRFETLDEGISVSPGFSYQLVANADRTVLTIQPTGPLSPGIYSVNLNESIQDDENNPMVTAETIRLTVGTDFTAPTIQQVQVGSSTLSEGLLTTGVERTGLLTITFSEPMHAQTTEAVSVSPAAPSSATWNAARDQLTLAFTPALHSETLYELNISAAAQDAQGNGLSQSSSYSFLTNGTLSLRPRILAVRQATVDFPGGVSGAALDGGQLFELSDFATLDLTQLIDDDQTEPVAGAEAGAIALQVEFNNPPVETSLVSATSFEVILDNSSPAPRVSFVSASVSGSVATILLRGNPFPGGDNGTPVYRLRLRGGNDGLRDANGNTMAEDYLLYVTF